MTNYTDSALYATSPDAMAAEEMGLPTHLDTYIVTGHRFNGQEPEMWFFTPMTEHHVSVKCFQGPSRYRDGRNLTTEHARNLWRSLKRDLPDFFAEIKPPSPF